MKIFLSAVSRQFKGCRDLLASDLRAIECEVKVQEDFQQGGGTLLEKLEDYIAGCDRVIVLIGDAYGSEPEEPARPAGRPRRSYTQWEYFFALGERLDGLSQPRKATFVYFASPQYRSGQPVTQEEDAAGLQLEFEKFIISSGKHYSTFDTADQLCRFVLRDGWQIQERPKRGVHLPAYSTSSIMEHRGPKESLTP